MQISTIGLDLAKHWFQVHGVDANGGVVIRRRLWRSGVIDPRVHVFYEKLGFVPGLRVAYVAKRPADDGA